MIVPVTTAYPDEPGPEPTEPPRPVAPSTGPVAAGALVIIAALGAVVGWIWAEVAPRIRAIRTEGGFAYADPSPEQAVAADGWFAILGLSAGLVAGLLAWMLLRRHRGVGVLVAVTAGSLAAAYLAWWVGYTIGEAEFERVRDAAIGSQVDGPLGLGMTDLDQDVWWRPYVTGVAAAQALMAALVYTMLAAFSSRPDLRPGPVRPAEPDWHPLPAAPPPDPLS